MNQHLFSAKTTTHLGYPYSFFVDDVFSTENKDVSFGVNGENFNKWFGGLEFSPINESRVVAWRLQKPAHEVDFIKEIGGSVIPVSLPLVYNLVKSKSMLISTLNIFFCHSPKTHNIHLLALFLNKGLWYMHGYGEYVRENRNWRSGAHIIIQEPL
jgi:hypothetical protein